MAVEDPDAALVRVWEEFDKRFGTHPMEEAKDLMKKLVHSSEALADNKDQLWNFAALCKRAGNLMETDQGHELKLLDYPDAQLNVTERLPPGLFEKWKSYAYKYKNDNNESIPFLKFCDWISSRAKQRANPDFERRNPSGSKPSYKDFEKGRPTPGGKKGGFAGFTRTVSEPQEQSLASRTTPGSTYGPCVIVKLSHPCSPGKYVEGAAIIDLQSTGTWLCDGLCDSLEVEDEFIEWDSFTL